MENFINKPFPEIVFGSSDTAQSQAIRRAIKAGQLRKIAPKLYSSNLKDSPADIIKKHRFQILEQRFPGGIISHRSALEGGASADGSIVLTYSYTKKIKLPGMVIQCIQGPFAHKEDTRFLTNLHISSRARAFLENMQAGREGKSLAKSLPKQEIERRLEQLIRIYGEDELNKLRDQAKKIADSLKMQSEYKKLNSLIGAILGTHDQKLLSSSSAKARALGKPYDPYRIELFATLAAALQANEVKKRECKIQDAVSLLNVAFFEAYFSNYIEGTEFEVDEAYNMVSTNQTIANRLEDSHDVLGTYSIVSNNNEMHIVPNSPAHLMDLLKRRHHSIMQARHNTMPGYFKDKVNKAGNTIFVKPEEVIGTLEKGFDIYQSLEPGFRRAAFMMFMISEIHPFIDGNGRIARIMMNAELIATSTWRIIIPTVYREDYLLALRQLSRKQDPQAYLRMLMRAQEFTASIKYSDYKKAVSQLTACDAFLEPREGKLKVR